MSLNNILSQYKNCKNNYINSIKNEIGFKNKLKKRIPNILTKSRFIAPFIIIPISLFNLSAAFIITIIFALTDAFDGYFARKYNAYSEYGRLLDPICDKVFAIGVIIPTLITNPHLTISTIILEFIISAINFNSSIKNNEPKSTYLGKFKTCVLSFNIILNYLNIMNMPLLLITNLTQLITAIDYYKIDKVKDQIKNKNVSVNNIDNNFINNDIQRQKNELLELKKSLINDNEIEINKQLIKKM